MDFIELIRKKFSFLLKEFGIEFLRENLPAEKAYKIISHPDSSFIVSLSDLPFSLSFNESIFSSSNIILEEPYTLLDENFNFLYRVTNHLGLFGNSILDKALIGSSSPLDLYYLQFSTYFGPKTFLLIINNTLDSTVTEINNSYISPPRSSSIKEEDLNNYIYLSTNLAYVDPNDPLFLLPINVYFLPANPNLIASKETIIENLDSEITTYDDIDSNSYIEIIPNRSGWLLFEQDNKYLSITNLTGLGSNLIIETEPYLYYILLGDIDTLPIRKRYGLPLIDDPLLGGIPRINLKGVLSP